jgi:hypothetical protein
VLRAGHRGGGLGGTGRGRGRGWSLPASVSSGRWLCAEWPSGEVAASWEWADWVQFSYIAMDP